MNKLNRPLRTWLAAALITAAAFAQAQPEVGEALSAELETPDIPLYKVEVIVFSYEDADPTEERFRARPERGTPSAVASDELEEFDFEAVTALNLPQPQPAEPNLTGLPGGASETVSNGETDPGADTGLNAAANTEQPGSFRFRILEPQELQLNNELARLQRIDAYTPLLHGGWIQQGLAESEARPFDLAYLGTFNPAGTVKLHVNRFLHVTLDLAYRPSSMQAARLTSANPSFGLSEVSLPPRLELGTGRRVRSNELHYFDHPYFGVLVMVTPYEPTAPSSSDGIGPAA